MSRKKSKSALKTENEFLRVVANNNVQAMNYSYKRNYTIHNLINIKPKNMPQRLLIESYRLGNKVISDGSAGTGKTFISMWLALNSLLEKDEHQNKIIILRSAVASRDIGFLPGTAEEKLEPYELPYKDIVGELLQKKTAYDDLKAMGKLQFMPTSYIRGLTWDNCVVVIDEVQNMSLHEINSIITRLGEHSRLLICGDYHQNDLENKRGEKTGIKDFLKIAKNVNGFDIISFLKEDIVRSKFVKEWICAKEELGL